MILQFRSSGSWGRGESRSCNRYSFVHFQPHYWNWVRNCAHLQGPAMEITCDIPVYVYYLCHLHCRFSLVHSRVGISPWVERSQHKESISKFNSTMDSLASSVSSPKSTDDSSDIEDSTPGISDSPGIQAGRSISVDSIAEGVSSSNIKTPLPLHVTTDFAVTAHLLLWKTISSSGASNNPVHISSTC